MSKNEKERTKNAHGTVLPVNSVITTRNTTEQSQPTTEEPRTEQPKTDKLNWDGCRLLAVTVIRQARLENDRRFFSSKDYDFWAAVAYGGKRNYMEGEDINYLIDNNIDRSLNGSARGRTPRCI